MDIAAIDQKLEAGENLKIKYRYPSQPNGHSGRPQYGIRSDKLVDVSVELDRFYTNFRGQTPIWLESDEVIEVVPDDGIYQEFTVE